MLIWNQHSGCAFAVVDAAIKAAAKAVCAFAILPQQAGRDEVEDLLLCGR
jgi:hypothetical protein